jgi:hypothetical protein
VRALRIITFGNYQLEQSISYLAEHFKTNGKYSIYLNKEIINNVSSNILKAKIQSRHISAKT